MSITVIAPVTTGKGAGREDEAGTGKEAGFFQEGTSRGKELSEGGFVGHAEKGGVTGEKNRRESGMQTSMS